MTEQPAESISLREVDRDNFDTIIKLKVKEDQTNFVASNIYSLAEAKIFTEMNPMAIYAGETPVGFLMYSYWPERSQYWVARLMIDHRYQGKGYGHEAMRQLIARMSAIEGCDQIFISYEPHNVGAKTLYASMGFQVTGEILEEEEVARLDLKKGN